MTVEELTVKLREIVDRGGDDPEVDHNEADDLLCQALSKLGYQAAVEEYRNITKWYA